MKNKINSSNLNLNINKDESNLNDFLYCWSQFDSRPNKIDIRNSYSTKSFNELFSNLVVEKNYSTEIIPSDDIFIINDKILIKINDDIYCSYTLIDRLHENSIISEITFYYKTEDNQTYIHELIEKLNDCMISFEENEYNMVNTISLNSNNIDLEPVDSSIDVDNFDIYYSKNTFKKVKKAIKEVKKSNKGLTILYGERGLGKTSLIKYIASKVDRIVIYIPNNLIEHTINNPEFRKILKRHIKPIIIIDDCEVIFSEYYSKSNLTTTNLLQIVDGFLSDSLEANIFTIFNVKNENEIDNSLLESNNLIDSIEFEYLSADEAQELSDHLTHDKKIKTSCRVVDVVKKNKIKNKNHFGL